MKKTSILFAFILLIFGFNYTTSIAQINLPYLQKFDEPAFPQSWTQTSTISPRWSISQSSNADGTPNEMMALGTAGIGVSRLIVGPINTAGLTSLNLQFKQKLSCTDTANFELRIQTSDNLLTWTNEGFTLDESSYNCANTIHIEINNNVGTTTYIAWVITGNHSNFSDWYLDDIIISGFTQFDVGIFLLEILSPRDDSSYGRCGLRTFVVNSGTLPQSFPVLLTITGSGNTFSCQSQVSDLKPGFLGLIDWDCQYPELVPGQYEITVCTQLIGDQNPLNDCASRVFVVPPDPVIVPNFQTSVFVNNSWNLVSVPGFHPNNQNVNTWWSGRDPQTNVYKFDGSYRAVTSVQPGIGYWMRHSGNQTYNTGDEWPSEGINASPHFPVIVNPGWNLIGGYESPYPTDKIFTIPPNIISAPIYKYSGDYEGADTLAPGFGYWVKASAAGQLMIDTSCVYIPPGLLNKSVMQTKLTTAEWGKIRITDANGSSFVLYSAHDNQDIQQFELPPPPPPGIFDIRYSCGKFVENLTDPKSIEMSGVVYPVKIEVEKVQVKISDLMYGEIDEYLSPGKEFVIYNSKINKLNISAIPVNISIE